MLSPRYPLGSGWAAPEMSCVDGSLCGAAEFDPLVEMDWGAELQEGKDGPTPCCPCNQMRKEVLGL